MHNNHLSELLGVLVFAFGKLLAHSTKIHRVFDNCVVIGNHIRIHWMAEDVSIAPKALDYLV